MKTRNITASQLESALEKINQDLYNGNIKMDVDQRFTSKGLPRHKVKIGINNSRELGGSYNPYSQRYIAAACWHVFGNFLDALGEICESDALVELSDKNYRTRVVHPKDHDWLDLSVGSMGYPLCQSEKCKCFE